MLDAMRKHRRSRLAALAAVAVILSVVAAQQTHTPRPPHRINRDSLERLGPGMTLPEVEAILGAPPGDYSTSPLAQQVRNFPRPQYPDFDGYEREEWLSDEVYVWC